VLLKVMDTLPVRTYRIFYIYVCMLQLSFEKAAIKCVFFSQKKSSVAMYVKQCNL